MEWASAKLKAKKLLEEATEDSPAIAFGGLGNIYFSQNADTRLSNLFGNLSNIKKNAITHEGDHALHLPIESP